MSAAAIAALLFATVANTEAESAPPAQTLPDPPQQSAGEVGEREPTPGLYVDALAFAGWRPRTAIMLVGVHQRHTYNRQPDSPLFDRTHLQGGFYTALTPAFGRYTAYAEWLPMQILRLRLEYAAVLYHGYLGVSSYESQDANWHEETRRKSKDWDVAFAHNLRGTIELRAKLWRFIAVSSWEFNYTSVGTGAPYVFDQWYGLLAQRDDWLIFGRTGFLFELIDGVGGETLRMGLAHSFRRTLGAGDTNQRVGLIMTWEPTKKLWVFDRPMFVMIAGFHVEDRWVQGQPNLFFGGGASFDILPQD